ncbi:MAG: glycosyltransferase family 9 protein [Candidatus Acidiferrales bacterium]
MKLSEPSSLLPRLPRGAEILIARLRSLGDIVLETPAIAALHAWRPDLRICLLVEPRFAAALEGNPAISELIFSRGFREMALALRRRRFPIVFNQHGGPRSAFLTAASGSPARICWKGFQFSFLYNVQVPDAAEFYGTPVVHTAEHRISQFYSTGLPRGPIPGAQVFPQPDARESVARALAGCGVPPGTPYAVLQPGARAPSMRWPAAKYAQIARWLREAHGIASVVNLGAQDKNVADEVRREMRDSAAIPEAFDLRALIALIAGARLFVGSDSGPVHLAAAAGRPSVVIYGSTNPAQWRPWRSEHRVVATGAQFRAMRGDKSVAVAEPRSIQSVGVDEVRIACEELLAATRDNTGTGELRCDAAKPSGKTA